MAGGTGYAVPFVIKKLLPTHLRRIGIALAVAAALLMSPLPASAGIIWDVGAGIGYAALVFAVALYLYPLRGGIAHRRLFSLSQHRRIGWIALSLAGGHAVILLVAQPLIGHYLLPSTPFYMLCGIAAFIALAVLVATGIRARSALREIASPGDRPPSIAAHALLAALLLALLGAHIIGSGQMVDSPAKVITACALLGLAALGSAWRAQVTRVRARSPWTMTLSCVAVVALALLPTPAGRSLLLRPATTPALLQVYFPHEKHTTVNCITCHHDFADKTGLGNCLDCHRSPRADLPHPAEVTFHVFCRDCHRRLALQKKTKHGPVRECSGCHAAPAGALPAVALPGGTLPAGTLRPATPPM